MTAAEAVRAERSRAATEAAALVVLADPAEALATEAEARAMSALERRAALALAAEAVRATEVDQAEAIAAVAGSALAEAPAIGTIPPEAEAPPLIGAMTPGAAGLAAKAISWARGRMEPVLALAESAMNLPATQGPTVELELTRFLRSIGADWTAMSTIRTK